MVMRVDEDGVWSVFIRWDIGDDVLGVAGRACEVVVVVNVLVEVLVWIGADTRWTEAATFDCLESSFLGDGGARISGSSASAF